MTAKHFFRNLKENLQGITDSEFFTKRNIVYALLFGILVLSLPIGVQLVQHQQQLKSRADVECDSGDAEYCENGQWIWKHAGEKDENDECQYAFDHLPEKDNQCTGTQPPVPTSPQTTIAPTRAAVSCSQLTASTDKQISESCAVCIERTIPGLTRDLRGNNPAGWASCLQKDLIQYWCNGGVSAAAVTQCHGIFTGVCARDCGADFGTVNVCGVDKRWVDVDDELRRAGYQGQFTHDDAEKQVYANTACPTSVTVPTNLRASCANGQTTISWDSNATKYDFRINGPATSSLPNNCTPHNVCLNDYTQKSITVAQSTNSTITYWVHAVDTVGKVGNSSEIKSFTCSGQGGNDTEKPSSTITISPASGYRNNDLITITFNAIDTGGSGVKLIHTALKEGVTTEADAKRDSAVWAASYQGKKPGDIRQARIPFYVEYLAEDNAGNLETVHGQVFTSGSNLTLTLTPTITGSLTSTPTPASSICADSDRFFDIWLSELPGIGSKTTKTTDCNLDNIVDILDFNIWRNLKFNLNQ